MKSLIIWMLIIFKTSSISAQADSTDFYIKNLGWHSFSEKIGFVPDISLFNDINYLIGSVKESNVKKLIEALGDSSKAVAAHIILTNVNTPGDISFSLKDDNETLALIFTYNKLSWKIKSGNVRHLSQLEMDKVKKRWISFFVDKKDKQNKN